MIAFLTKSVSVQTSRYNDLYEASFESVVSNQLSSVFQKASLNLKKQANGSNIFSSNDNAVVRKPNGIQLKSIIFKLPYYLCNNESALCKTNCIFNLEQCSNLKNEQSEVLKLHLFFSSCLLPLFILQWQLTIVLLLHCLYCYIKYLLNLKAKHTHFFIFVLFFSQHQQLSPETNEKSNG